MKDLETIFLPRGDLIFSSKAKTNTHSESRARRGAKCAILPHKETYRSEVTGSEAPALLVDDMDVICKISAVAIVSVFCTRSCLSGLVKKYVKKSVILYMLFMCK